MNKKYAVAAVFCLLSCLNPASAETLVADFLNIPSDPKSVACGETIMALTDSPAAILSNPCGMLNLYQAKMSFNEILMWEEMKYYFVGFGFPSKYGNIGAGLSFLDYGNIDGLQADGITPVSLSNIYDMVATLNYVYPLKSDVPVTREHGGVGMNVKFIQSRVDKYKTDALALDLGVMYKVPLKERVFASLVYKNIGTSLKFYGEAETISPTTGFGLKWEKPEWSDIFVLWDLQKNADLKSTSYSYGAGFNPFYGISVWGGWKDQPGTLNSGLRLGFGINISNYKINYALAPMKEYGTVHYFAIDIPILNISDKVVAYDYYTRMHFQDAENKFYQGDYVAARQLIEDILAVYPNYAPAKVYLEKINSELDKIESRKKVIVRTFVTRGQIAVEKGNYAKACSYFEKALKIEAVNNEALDGLISAEKLLEESKFIKQKRKLENTAIRLYSKGDYINAKEVFNEILKGDPEDYDASRFVEEIDSKLAKMHVLEVNDFFLKGANFFKNGRYKDAMKYFKAVLIAAPNRYDVQDFMAQCEERIKLKELKGKDTDLAAEKIKSEAELKSKFLRALGYYEDSKFELSLKTFNEASALADELEITDYNDKIQKHTEKLVDVLSDQNLRIAFNAKDKGDYEKAIEAYNKVLLYNPNHELAKEEIKTLGLGQAKKYFEEGMSYYSSGNIEMARESFMKSLKFKPDYAESKRALDKLQ